MIPGVKISMGGQEYEVPALNFGQIRRLGDKINVLSSMGGQEFKPEHMEAICGIVHAALSRNYPEVTLDQIEEMIDLRNSAAVIKAVMGQSGFEASPGEAPAGDR